jgi:crotonobetainyl-CoA:carnitine CoA-transferase CaiB-like acyl-CoA transferase
MQKQFEVDASCPLDGVRVLDLSRLVAGNMLTLQLADFGAEVIKIEDPHRGDPLRAWRVNDISMFWKAYARNKKSVALDLRHVLGRKILADLAATADILVENFRPGVLEKMGFSPSQLHARNAGLVIVRISGWGQTGPYRERPGFGTLVEGMSGFAARNGFPDRPPVLPPLSLADMVAGIYGAGAALVALRHREVNGGKGQVIDLPLLDPIVSVLGPEAGIFRLTGEIRPRTGSRSLTASPRNTFRTKDGRWIAISASMQVVVERLFHAIGRPDMIVDPRFRKNSDRISNADACEQPIADFIAARSLSENMEIFEQAEVTAAPIYDVDQFLEDPHVRDREVIVEMPDREMGTAPMHNVIPRLDLTPGKIRMPAPELGQHTTEVLMSLGLDEAELNQLQRESVISGASCEFRAGITAEE